MNVVVLIADIVKSREISDRPVFQRGLKHLLADIGSRSTHSLLSPLTLGDEFQAVYGGFDAFLPDLIEIMSRIYPQKLRVAVSHGPLSTVLNPEAALEMDGPAFTCARELLEELKRTPAATIQLTTTEHFNPDLVNLCLKLLSKRSTVGGRTR